MKRTQWQLLANGEPLGIVTLVGIDQPWFLCKFVPTDRFALAKPLFDEELKLLSEEREAEWEAAQEALESLKLVLVPMQPGETLNDFLLHIDGEDAWFRY